MGIAQTVNSHSSGCGASANSGAPRNSQCHARTGQIMALNGEPCPMTFTGQRYMTTIVALVRTGVWSQINAYLVKLVRLAEGREEEPRETIIDSQSVKTAEKKGPEQGVDGNKRVKGRKRHLVVDTLGMVLNCLVSAANMADVKAASAVERTRIRRQA